MPVVNWTVDIIFYYFIIIIHSQLIISLNSGCKYSTNVLSSFLLCPPATEISYEKRIKRLVIFPFSSISDVFINTSN